jgi:hypothetical protein
VAAADQKTIFGMGFFMADVRPALPTESAEDQRLVPELLKGHLHLGVSAIAMIDLDDYIFGSQNRLYQGIPLVVSGGGGVASRVYRSHEHRPGS